MHHEIDFVNDVIVVYRRLAEQENNKYLTQVIANLDNYREELYFKKEQNERSLAIPNS